MQTSDAIWCLAPYVTAVGRMCRARWILPYLTVFLQLFGKPKPFLLSKNSWNCTWSVIPSIRYSTHSERSCEAS